MKMRDTAVRTAGIFSIEKYTKITEKASILTNKGSATPRLHISFFFVLIAKFTMSCVFNIREVSLLRSRLFKMRPAQQRVMKLWKHFFGRS